MRAGYTLISIPPVPMGGITWKFSAYSTTVGSFGLPSRNITERRGLFEGNLLIASWAPVFVVSSFACYNILFFFKRVYIRRRREGRIFLAPKKRKKKGTGAKYPRAKHICSQADQQLLPFLSCVFSIRPFFRWYILQQFSISPFWHLRLGEREQLSLRDLWNEKEETLDGNILFCCSGMSKASRALCDSRAFLSLSPL
jgi:hypothetical protein